MQVSSVQPILSVDGKGVTLASDDRERATVGVVGVAS